MTLLAAAALFWIAVHVGIAGTAVRRRAVAAVGENGFRLGFSIASAVAITALVVAYRRARPMTGPPLWILPHWTGVPLAILLAIGFILFVGSIAAPNPTAVGGERRLRDGPRGVGRVTRHPMLWSFALWSIVHVLGSGDRASLLFFGAFGVTALVGMPSIDRKLARRDPDGFRRLAATTSIVPFGAVLAGRAVIERDGWAVPLVAGLALFALVLAVHGAVFGVAPFPGGWW